MADHAISHPTPAPQQQADAFTTAGGDRVLRALLNGSPNPGWAPPAFGDDVAGRAALVLRVVRDDMVLASLAGSLPAATAVESYLNTRIEQLSGTATITGDTTLRANQADS